MSTIPGNYALSEHFSYAEGVGSEIAERMHIDNTPSLMILQTMMRAAVKMEKVRSVLCNEYIHVNSWYRCPALNTQLHSKPTSQHTFGEAIDFVCPEFGTPAAICKLLIESIDLINYDQLILEHSWVHISFAILSGKPRNQVLSLLVDGTYSSGLTDIKGHPL